MIRSPIQRVDEILVDERLRTIYVPRAMEAEFFSAMDGPGPEDARAVDFITAYAVVIVDEPEVPAPWWLRLWRWLRGGKA